MTSKSFANSEAFHTRAYRASRAARSAGRELISAANARRMSCVESIDVVSIFGKVEKRGVAGLLEQCLGCLLAVQLLLLHCFYLPGAVSLGDHVMQRVQPHFADRGF